MSVGFFDKTVKNFLGTGVFTRPLFGLLDPTSGAPGTRSAQAITEIDTLGVDQSPANLFTMVALFQEEGAGLPRRLNSKPTLDANGVLPQSYVDLILGRNDIVGIAGEDPEMQFRVTQPVNTDEGNVNGWEFAWQHFFGESGFGAAASYTMVEWRRRS